MTGGHREFNNQQIPVQQQLGAKLASTIGWEVESMISQAIAISWKS
jgi:hypothetical protein